MTSVATFAFRRHPSASPAMIRQRRCPLPAFHTTSVPPTAQDRVLGRQQFAERAECWWTASCLKSDSTARRQTGARYEIDAGQVKDEPRLAVRDQGFDACLECSAGAAVEPSCCGHQQHPAVRLFGYHHVNYSHARSQQSTQPKRPTDCGRLAANK
jgi:hypothetical protein